MLTYLPVTANRLAGPASAGLAGVTLHGYNACRLGPCWHVEMQNSLYCFRVPPHVASLDN